MAPYIAQAVAGTAEWIEGIRSVIDLGGTAVALVLLYLLFSRLDAKIEAMGTMIASQIREERTAWSGQVEAIIEELRNDSARNLDALRAITDDHMKLTRETIIAVKGLEATVRELQTIVATLKNGPRRSSGGQS